MDTGWVSLDSWRGLGKNRWVTKSTPRSPPRQAAAVVGKGWVITQSLGDVPRPWAQRRNTEDWVSFPNFPRRGSMLKSHVKGSFYERLPMEDPRSETGASSATHPQECLWNRSTRPFWNNSGPVVSFQRTPGTPKREAAHCGRRDPGHSGTKMSCPIREGASQLFLRDPSPHGVGAANSGLHSTSCRSSDAGEVHSLGRKYERCNIPYWSH